MPSFFPTKDAAVGHMYQFMTWYNEDHMHNGLNLLPPAMVHHGRVDQVVTALSVMTAAPRAIRKRHPQCPEEPPDGRNQHSDEGDQSGVGTESTVT